MTVQAEIIQRVFFVKCSGADDGRTGTAFTIDVDEREYLVSAKHVIDPEDDPKEVRVSRNGGWDPIPIAARVWCPSDGLIDVAVVALTTRLASKALTSLPTASGLGYGQDTFILGFPYGRAGDQLINGQPLPFVKKAVSSGTTRDSSGRTLFWLDGHGNEGFSGAPVSFLPHGKSAGHPFAIAGIVFGYETALEGVSKDSAPTGMNVETNAGFVLAHDIKYAVEGAKALGNGAV